MTHLFLFTLGPVQSFIAQARKTQDLYAGSQILSDLTRVAVDLVEKDHKVIFPKTDIVSMPNRFIAEVTLSDKETPQDFGKQVEKAVRDEWIRMAMNGLLEQGLKAKKFSLPDGFQEQIQQHLEIHWVFAPIEEGEEEYKKAFDEAEALLAAVKRSAFFEQYQYNGYGETGRKCSVDGQRNIKFYRRSERQKNWKDHDVREHYLFAKGKEEAVLFDFEGKNLGIPISFIQPGEGLSAVSFVKRGYHLNGQKKEFPSTADIALLKTIAFWKENHLTEYQNYRKAFARNKKDDFNAQLFYEENLNEKYFEKEGLARFKEQIPELLIERRKLEQFAKDNKHKLTKYYAILLFDGDGMGKLLNGDYLKDKTRLKEFHGEFSEKLGDFASNAEKYLNANNHGCTVYAGGDDFLGFVNLESLFDVLIELHRLYQKLVHKELQDKDKDWFKEKETPITFSAGICIAHYKEPLSLVLAKARDMEKKAKDFREAKNAFAISVMKGSGEDHETVWGFEKDSLEKLKSLVDSMRGDDATFSNTFIKSFQVELRRLLDPSGSISIDKKILRTELRRLLLRSANSKFNKVRKQQLRDDLLVSIWDDFFIPQQITSEQATLDNFFEMLNICDFLHRTLNPPPKKQKEKAHAELTN